MSILTVLFWLCTRLAAQEYIFDYQYFGPEDGLPHREVNAFCEDRKGFIWIGTKAGLCRFDGYGFQLYPASKYGFLTDNFGFIFELSDGALALIPWGPVEDFDLWDPYSGAHTTFRKKFGAAAGLALQNTRLINWCRDKTGKLYFQDTGQPIVWILDPLAGLRSFKIPVANAQLLAVDSSVWILDRGNPRIYGFDETGKIVHTEDLAGIPSKIYDACPGSRPVLFFANNEGTAQPSALYRIVGDGVRKMFDFRGSHRYYYPLCGSTGPTEDCLLMYSGKIYNQRGDVLFDLKNKVAEEVSISERAVMTDSRGRIWMGNDFGFRILGVHRNHFSNYLTQGAGAVLGDHACRGICVSNSTLWNNQERRGLFRVDLSTGASTRVYLPDEGFQFNAIGELRDGNLVVTFSHSVHIIRRDGSLLRTSSPFDGNVWSAHERPDGLLWIGTEKGLHLFDPQTGTQISCNAKAGFEAFANTTIYDFQETAGQNLLICSGQGLFEVDPEKGVLRHFWKKGERPFRLPAEAVFHLYQDPDGTCWLATDNGLLHLDLQAKDPDRSLLQQYTKAEGLSNNIVYAVYPDAAGNLWLSSDYGIMRFNKATGQVTAYLKQDGICDNEFNRISHFQDAKGRIYFGTINGITAFDPRELTGQNGEKPVLLGINRYQQFDGQTNRMTDWTQELLQSNRITLQPDDRFFQIDFSLLTLQHANQNSYAYRIDDVDADWNYLKEHTLRFGRLPYGRHVLHIRGQDASGKWSENELSIPVVVRRPFYLQNWFFLLALVLAVALIGGYFRYRTHQLLNRNRVLEQRVRERTATIEKQAEELRLTDQLKSRFFANVSHELRTPLTLMLGPVGAVLREAILAEKHRALLDSARRSGQQLLGLIHEILHLSKLESGRMSVHETASNPCDLLRNVYLQFESHARFRGVELEYQNGIGTDVWVLLDRKKVEHIVGNLLSNAIKFTDKGGRVILDCSQEGDRMLITVEDNGRGIHPNDLPHVFERFYQGKHGSLAAEGGTGIGLSLSAELAELMGGTIRVTSAPGQGSVFCCTLPFRETAKPDDAAARQPDDEVSDSLLRLVASTPARYDLPSLLIVEDNPGLQQFLSLILQEKFAVETAGNGQQALDWLAERPFDQLPSLILSDVMMPQMDGFQLLAHLKGDDRYRHLPVVMLTARAELADKLQALRLGVDDYLLKPFEEEELLARVENLLKFAALRYQYAGKNPQNAERTDDDSAPAEQPAAAGPALRLSAVDAAWLKQLEELIRAHIENPHLNVEFLADHMNLSTRHLQRQVKAISGLTLNQYMQEARLQRGRQLLERDSILVKQAAGRVGYRDVKHFTRLYKERFGKLPSLTD